MKVLIFSFLMVIISGCNLIQDSNQENISSFGECAAAGYPIMESYPRQCRTSSGDLFVEQLDEPTQTPTAEEEQVFCTMDAKVCPDGSSVGRVPPSCEFAPCPGE